MNKIDMILFSGKSVEDGDLVLGSLLSANGKTYIYPHDWADLDDLGFGRAFVEVVDVQIVFLYDE